VYAVYQGTMYAVYQGTMYAVYQRKNVASTFCNWGTVYREKLSTPKSVHDIEQSPSGSAVDLADELED